MDINRETVYFTLMEIEKNKAYSNIAVNHNIAANKPDSPAFVREVVYGVLRNRIYLDHIMKQLIPRGLKGVRKEAYVLLQIGLYQLIFMDAVPEYAAVNESVKMAKSFAKGRDGFINGVLRGYIRKKDSITMPDRDENPVEYLSVKYSYAKWIVELWIDQYGEEKAERLLQEGNRIPELSLRVNTLKTTRDELSASLTGKGFEIRNGDISDACLFSKGSGILSTEEFRKGLFSVQDQASIAAVEIMPAEPGDHIIDICAAPGGKSFALAERMQNRGRIISCDIYMHKLELINNEAERLGISIVDTALNDGTQLRSDWVETADGVYVDGPCSGLGVIRKKPEIKYNVLDDGGRALARKQLELLDVSAHYVKKNGYLVYSTCTINKKENTDVISRFLKLHREFELERSRQFLPGFDETDGFFVCRMRKRNN